VQATVETTVAAPIAEVWRAYATPEAIVRWNAASDDWHTTAASVDLREGGAFDPETPFPVEYQQAGWQAILDNFARYVAAQRA